MLARDGEGMGSGLHSALIQDAGMAQGKPENTVYDHGHPAFQRKNDRGQLFEHVSPWPRGVTGANDPLFPEPETAVSKAFNGGAARWGANDGEVKRPWAGGGRPRYLEDNDSAGPELEPRRAMGAQANPVNGSRRWDDTRPQEKTSSWNGESRQAPRDTDATWRGGAVGPARHAQPKNDIHWRKPSDHPAARPNGGRPGAPYAARGPVGLKKYRKEELLGVLHSMKQQVGDQLPIPEGSNLEDDVKEVWRGDATWRAAQGQSGGHVENAPHAPPGLDPYIKKLHIILPQLTHLGVPSPLQLLKANAYFYKDPQRQVHGPFTAESLKSWNSQGYLYPDLECTDSEEASTFFPFSDLDDLWSIVEKLGLTPEDVQKLADAELRLAKQPPAPPPAPAVTDSEGVHHLQGAGQQAQFAGALHVDPVVAHHPPPVVEDQLADPTEHGWGAPAANKRPVGMQAQQGAQVHQRPAVIPVQSSTMYDPIDDIIDEGPRTVVPGAPGERILQPFVGMGSAARAAETMVAPAAPRHAADAPVVAPRQTERGIPDAMSHLRISNAPTAQATTVAPQALFGEATQVPSVAQVSAPKTNKVSDAVNVQRIAPAQLFEQFSNARDAQGPANGHALPDATVMQQPPAPPPRAVAPQQVASASRPTWGAAPVRPAKFDEIQAEEIKRRNQEDAAAQAAAKTQLAQAEAERLRRAAWMSQPKPVNLRQIIEDDEECAADLEGGCYEGEQDEYVEQTMGYNPWQGQAALPADGRGHVTATHMGADVLREGSVDAPAAPAAPHPSAPYSRTAAQVLGKDSRAAGTQPVPKRAAAANTAKPAWQTPAGRPAEQAAPAPPPPATEVLQEPEPEILKNNPDFYEWCMCEMKRLQGDMNVLVVLLETGANCEIMDFARSNLKGDNIGAFVSEFIKRKAQAATAKPTGRKRKGKAAATASTAVAPQAAPARSGARPVAETVGDGWEAVGAKGKPKRKGGAPAQAVGQNVRLGGGAFAVLPSL